MCSVTIQFSYHLKNNKLYNKESWDGNMLYTHAIDFVEISMINASSQFTHSFIVYRNNAQNTYIKIIILTFKLKEEHLMLTYKHQDF